MLYTFRELQKGEFIVVGADTAAGGHDYSAAQFISKTNNDIPLVYHSKVTTTVMTNNLLDILTDIYDKTGVTPVIAYERNFGGSFELERLNTLNREKKFTIYKEMASVGTGSMDYGDKLGWTTTAGSRAKMLEDLKNCIDANAIRIYDKRTINELYNFVVKLSTGGRWKAQAENGAHDDLVMSLAIAYQVYQYARTPETTGVNPNSTWSQTISEDW